MPSTEPMPHRVLWSWHHAATLCGTQGRHIVGRCSCGEWLEAKSADDISDATKAHRWDAQWARWVDYT